MTDERPPTAGVGREPTAEEAARWMHLMDQAQRGQLTPEGFKECEELLPLIQEAERRQ